eukprot:2069638-Amphidinium_carterae.1
MHKDFVPELAQLCCDFCWNGPWSGPKVHFLSQRFCSSVASSCLNSRAMWGSEQKYTTCQLPTIPTHSGGEKNQDRPSLLPV